MNRVTTVTDLDGGVSTYTYDAVGNRSSITYPNGTIAEYTYDSQNRLIKLFNHKTNGDTISCYTYTLGPAGNRTRVKEHTGRTVDYTYDATYKLIQERIDDPDFGLRIISYTYDPVGNRLAKIDNNDTITYTYDNNDRLLTENSQLATRNYIYDNNGNTITKTDPTENINYAYDYQNRIIRVDDGNSCVEYAYDTDGIRIQKLVDGLNAINYIVDKNRDYAQVLQEREGNGTVIVSYNYGNDLISQNRDGFLSYYHYDGQMSARQLTDDSQNITDGYTYDAFGILINKFGATVNDYLYTGEQYDANIGFYYLRARYYNAGIGRFFTMDEFTGLMFEPMSLHKYLYCNNFPINKKDPSGYFDLLDLYCTITIISALSIAVSHILTNYFFGNYTYWDGALFVYTVGKWIGVGFIHGILTGRSDKEPKYSTCIIYTIMWGATFTLLTAGGGSGKISLESPPMFGSNPWILSWGPTIYYSLSFALGWEKDDKNQILGPGISWTVARFGLARNRDYDPIGSTKSTEWHGIESGLDIMVGWTYAHRIKNIASRFN